MWSGAYDQLDLYNIYFTMKLNVKLLCSKKTLHINCMYTWIIIVIET